MNRANGQVLLIHLIGLGTNVTCLAWVYNCHYFHWQSELGWSCSTRDLGRLGLSCCSLLGPKDTRKDRQQGIDAVFPPLSHTGPQKALCEAPRWPTESPFTPAKDIVHIQKAFSAIKCGTQQLPVLDLHEYTTLMTMEIPWLQNWVVGQKTFTRSRKIDYIYVLCCYCTGHSLNSTHRKIILELGFVTLK